MKDYYTLLKDFLEKHFPAQLPKLEAIRDKPVEVIMMYNMYKRSAKNALKERVGEAKGGQIMPGDYVKNQHGNIYQRVDGKVGKHDAYVRVTNGKAGKKKTGLHDSFKLTLINKDELKENVDKVVGGIPYRRHGNKVIISEPLDDATKERLIDKAKKHGYFAQPNQAGGITITLKKGMYEELKESTINEVKEMTFGAYLDDLDNRFVDLMKAAKGLNAEGSQEIDMRATINQNFTLFRNYISALKKEYSNELNKELTFSINEEDLNEDVSKHTVKHSKSNNTYQVWLGDEIVTDFATKERADAEAKRLNALQNVNETKEEYKVGDKVTYLGHPAEVTFVDKDQMDRTYYNVSYDKGYGKTKATNIYNKDGEIEALEKEKKSKFKKHGEMSGFDMRGINEAKKDIYDKFLENPTSPKGRAKAIISKFKKKYGEDATEMAVDRFSKQNNLKPEEKYILQYITKNKIKITSQPGGPNLSVVNEAKATCCHRCGRVHVKGSGCKKPYLKGKDSCAINEIETLKEFFNK